MMYPQTCDLSFNFQLGNTFYCSILIMVQGDFLGVLEFVALPWMIRNQNSM
jgi:hypothetical protein